MVTGSIWKKMTFFAFPILLGNLFQQLYSTVDSLIVGNFLGSSALAAVSSSSNLIFMLISLLSGLAVGAGVVVARYYGAQDKENIHLTVHTTIAFGLVAGVVVMLIGVLGSPLFLKWMDTPESVMPNSVTYLKIYFAGAIGFVMYNICVGILQAVGDSKHPLYYLIISSVLNLLLDIFFIAVLHTGVGGAAFATVISQFVSFFMCAARLLRTQESYRVTVRDISFDRKILKEIIRIGLPSGFQNAIIAIANVVVQSNINAFGEVAMAGCGAYSKIEGFGFLPITSFNMAITTFVGQNLGAQQYERAKKGGRFGIFTSMALAEAVGLIVYILAPYLIAAFDSNPEVIKIGVDKARYSALFFFLLACTHSISSVLRGAGKSVVPMLVMMIFWCGLRVSILSIMIPLTHDIRVLYLVYPLTWFFSSLFLVLYMWKADWLGNYIRQQEAC